MKRIPKTLLVIFLPILVLALGIVGLSALILSRPDPATKPPEALPPLVRVMEVAPEDLQLSVTSQGTVTPSTESALVPEVSGRVVHVSPSLVSGGFFDEGEVLLALDPTDYEQAVVTARAQVAQAKVRLAREEAEANVAREEWRDLRGDETASPLTTRELQVAEAKAALEASRAALVRAELDLHRTRIEAPFAGRVRTEAVDLGQFVSRGQAVAVIYAIDRAEVRLPLPDHELAFLDLALGYRGDSKRGAGPRVFLRSSFGGTVHEWEGRIVRTEGEIDPKTRMVHAIAEVEDPYGRSVPGRPPLAAGMFVEAEILGRTVKDVVVLPRAALRQGDRVFLIDGENRLRFRDVGVLRTMRDDVVVQAGLAEGERICLSPLAAVTDGMRVRVLENPS